MIAARAAAANADIRRRPKNAHVLGSFWPGCFQSSLAHPAGADPLPLALLDPLGLPCVLHIALYGDEFEPLTPLALLQLPTAPAFLRACLAQSPALLEVLAAHLDDSYASSQSPETRTASSFATNTRPALEFFVSILGVPVRGPCQHFQCDATDELNLVAHAWRFHDQRITQNLACAAVCDLGLFGASPHLGAVHQSLAPASAGVPFERVRALPATVHGGRFSPCNAQFRVPIGGDEADAALSAHSFFAVAHDAANSRTIVQFFLVAANPREEAELASAIETAATVGTLVCNLDAMASASCVNLAGSEHGAMRAARLLELALLYTDAAEKP